MYRRRAELLDDTHVTRSAVALVPGEAVAGVKTIEIVHQAVARDLGDDRGRRDAEAFAIAADNPGLRKLQPGNLATIDQHVRRRMSQRRERALEGKHRRPVDVEAVDLIDASAADANRHRAFHD